MYLKCIILVTLLQKLPSDVAESLQRPLIFDFGDVKLRDLAILLFF